MDAVVFGVSLHHSTVANEIRSRDLPSWIKPTCLLYDLFLLSLVGVLFAFWSRAVMFSLPRILCCPT